MDKFYTGLALSMIKGMFGSTKLEYVHSNKDGKKTLETREYNDYIFDFSMACNRELPSAATIDIIEDSHEVVEELADDHLRVIFNVKVSNEQSGWSLGHLSVTYPKFIAEKTTKATRIDPENPVSFSEYLPKIDGEDTMALIKGKEWVEQMKNALLHNEEMSPDLLPFYLIQDEKYGGPVKVRYFDNNMLEHCRNIYKSRAANYHFDFSNLWHIYGPYCGRPIDIVNRYTMMYVNMIGKGMRPHEVHQTVNRHIGYIMDTYPEGKNREEYLSVLTKYIEHLKDHYLTYR